MLQVPQTRTTTAMDTTIIIATIATAAILGTTTVSDFRVWAIEFKSNYLRVLC